jgi:hypothetical protein
MKPINLKLKILFPVFCLLFAGNFSTLQAQSVAWTNNMIPAMNPSSITVLSDTGYIDVDFTPLGGAVNNAKIEVQLPANVAYQGTVTATEHAAGTVTATPEGTIAVGIKVNIIFASSSVSAGTRVHLQVKVIANTCAFTSGTATVNVLSGAAPVPSGAQTLTVSAHKPNIRMIVVEPKDVDLTTPGGTEKASFTYNIDVTNGTARSLKITLTGDQYTFLENFQLDGTSITAVLSGDKVWTITLTDAVFSSSARQLTFDAYSNRNGSRNISTAFQYPAASNCVSGTGTILSLIYPAVTGIPQISLVGTSLKATLDLNASGLSWTDVPMDGQTEYYAFVTYQNASSAVAAYDVVGLIGASRGYDTKETSVNNIYVSLGFMT